MELYLHTVAPRSWNAWHLFSVVRVSTVKNKDSVGERGNRNPAMNRK
jgi:hypothetical protein